jgi:Putative addiction module component
VPVARPDGNTHDGPRAAGGRIVMTANVAVRCDQMTADELKAEALRLEPRARAELARALLASLDDLSETEIEQLWLEEAARRDRELDEGTVEAIPADEVFARARARLG